MHGMHGSGLLCESRIPRLNRSLCITRENPMEYELSDSERESIIQETLSRLSISLGVETVDVGGRPWRVVMASIKAGDTTLCFDYVPISAIESEMGDRT